jgi:hypothetical protein
VFSEGYSCIECLFQKQLSSGEEGEGTINQLSSTDDRADEAPVQMVGEVTGTEEAPHTSGGTKVFKTPTKRKRSARNMSPSDDQSKMVKEAYDVVRTITSKWQYKDDSQVFGDYMASKLRPLNAYAKNTVQHMINDILYAAASGRYDHPPQMDRTGYNYRQYYSSSSTSGQNTPVHSPYPKDAADADEHQEQGPILTQLGGSDALSKVLTECGINETTVDY